MRQKLETLRRILVQRAPLLVAYSGGVDSSFLLAFATRELGRKLVHGVLADSASLPRKAKERALENAVGFGAEVIVIQTGELEDPRYARNGVDRCYFCKAALFERMEIEAHRLGVATLAYGENADDARMIRAGARAARQFEVLAPLRDSGLGKAEIREASRQMGLPTADDVSQPCLSSRIAQGVKVTAEALGMVERAEERVRALGFREFRVRHRIENGGLVGVFCAGPQEMIGDERAAAVLDAIRAAGYPTARIDSEGYQPPRELSPDEVERALERMVGTETAGRAPCRR